MHVKSENSLNEVAQRVANDLKRPSLAPIWISAAVMTMEFTALSLTFWFAEFSALSPLLFSPWNAAGLACFLALSVAGVSQFIGLYRLHSLCRPLRSAVLLLAICLSFGCLALVFAPAEKNSPLWFSAILLAGAAFLVPLRGLVALAVKWARDSGLTQRRAVVIGGGENAAKLTRGLEARPDNDIRLCAIFDDRKDKRSPDQVGGLPKIGRFDDLIEFTKQAEIDLIIITIPIEAEERISWLMDKFSVLPQQVHLSSFTNNFAFRDGRASEVAKRNASQVFAELIPAAKGTFSAERRLTKRLFDILISSVAIVLLSPVFLVTAIAVRLDSPGPIFFRQTRHGFSDRPIKVLKFRSMFDDQCDPNARKVVGRGDPRVTKVGRIIRKSSIDELPQLFNVLSGSLSLVGPRPHAVNAVSSDMDRFVRIVDGYSARHRLPPGITGWAQINGWRGEIDDPEKLRNRFAHDLYYIENWSVWMDLKILLKTPMCLFNTQSAY